MRSHPNSLWHLIAVPLICGLTVFFLVPLLVRWQESLPLKELSVLRRVHQMALDRHVLEQDPKELIHDAIAGMVRGLDPHSRYIPPADLERFQQEEIAGSYTGIGVVLAGGITPPTIEFRFPGSPGRSAGLQVGDQILAINGEDVSNLPGDQAVAVAVGKITEAKQNLVQLSIGRGQAAPIEVAVYKAEVHRPSVKWARFIDADQGIAYVHLAEFKQRSIAEFDAAIEALQSEDGPELRALILDLRFNRGGLLSGAILLANRFLEEGMIVSLKRRDGEVVEEHLAKVEECRLGDTPLVLLLNGGSASASEVVAGALQDHRRAVIVGVRSFGKGVVQEIFGSTDPPFRLKLTTSHYYTPKGRSIERRMRRAEDGADPGGIEPERNVSLSPLQRRLVAASLARPEPPPDDREAVSRLAEALGFAVPSALPAAEDAQLQAALEEALALIEAANPGTGSKLK